ncbi:metal ABC transporter solute-binding protein, Zn/Mn family [Ideonella oryzae]|uniref:Zinc ABC transporter substrate-binding protein n=1 Tax=Ideonella oryzae TaxID=2937441 RepID=A0ABT1BNZ0_9BURK|nr:zinc ABC transporter substrate-binding protein [Ideonella oryzae]MCO5977927.1 zinc ABC transporter substrate-binding protein [Ideonella oryzae]
MNRATALRTLAALLAGPALGPISRSWAQESNASTGPLRVVASFSILADMVQQVAGPLAEVHTLVGPGGDAHVFEPRPADAQKLARADLVVLNGLHLEGWMDRLIQASGFKGRRVVASDGVTPRLLDGHPDPHAWQSLRLAAIYVRNIRAGLKAALPRQAARIDQQAARYLADIEGLDARVRAQIGALAPAQRRAVTTHDAFGYFAAEYGVTWLAPQGWTTAEEVSAKDVTRVVRELRAQHVRALFLESAGDPRLMQQIAREAGVHIGGELYADTLSPAGGPADTYLHLFEHNVKTMLQAMRGS